MGSLDSLDDEDTDGDSAAQIPCGGGARFEPHDVGAGGTRELDAQIRLEPLGG